MEQPCALTTSVSQTSEKRVPGSRLVTRTGRLIGTRELRRTAAGDFTFCIVRALLPEVRDAARCAVASCTDYVTLKLATCLRLGSAVPKRRKAHAVTDFGNRRKPPARRAVCLMDQSG